MGRSLSREFTLPSRDGEADLDKEPICASLEAERLEGKIESSVRGMGVEIVGVSPEGFVEVILKATRCVEWETSK